MALSRSENMARIRGQDTTPETKLIEALLPLGHELVPYGKTPVGRPDVVFPAEQVAVFLDGCFWHGCPQHYSRPRTRPDFWQAKLAENVARDRAQTLALEAAGWRVVRVWEHEVVERPPAVVARVREALTAERWAPEDDARVVRVDPLDPVLDTERRRMEALRDACVVSEAEGPRVTGGKRRRAKT